MRCPVCGASAKPGPVKTHFNSHVVSAAGHDHDDRCRLRIYKCPNGHLGKVSRRNRCPAPGCNWVGKAICGACGTKANEWPE